MLQAIKTRVAAILAAQGAPQPTAPPQAPPPAAAPLGANHALLANLQAQRARYGNPAPGTPEAALARRLDKQIAAITGEPAQA